MTGIVDALCAAYEFATALLAGGFHMGAGGLEFLVLLFVAALALPSVADRVQLPRPGANRRRV